MSYESEQLLLPIEIREPQRVSWYVVEQVEKRRFLFWKQLVTKAIWDNKPYSLAQVSLDVEDISKLKDADLRYALRFSAAAKSMGSIPDSQFSSHGNFVTVNATSGSLEKDFTDSRFSYATYTGVVREGIDTFLEDILRFAPDLDENH